MKNPIGPRSKEMTPMIPISANSSIVTAQLRLGRKYAAIAKCNRKLEVSIFFSEQATSRRAPAPLHTSLSGGRNYRDAATTAAHRLLRRVKEAHARFDNDPAHGEGRRLYDFCDRIGIWSRFYRDLDRLRAETDFWQTTTIKGRLYFHPPDVLV
jgi:hypothetical protein